MWQREASRDGPSSSNGPAPAPTDPARSAAAVQWSWDHSGGPGSAPSNPARLAELRAELRPRVLASALVDGPQYAADVTAAFRRMWQTAVEQNRESAL